MTTASNCMSHSRDKAKQQKKVNSDAGTILPSKAIPGTEHRTDIQHKHGAAATAGAGIQPAAGSMEKILPAATADVRADTCAGADDAKAAAVRTTDTDS